MALSLNNPTKHFHIGPFVISVANLIMYLLVIALFATPLIVASMRLKLRQIPKEEFNEILNEKLKFLAYYVYMIKSLIVADLIIVGASGVVLAIRGPSWGYSSSASRFVHSMHFWSVQLLFLLVLSHILGNIWRSDWQGRAYTMWVSGSLTYFALLFSAFTGGLIAVNHNSQWLALQSKNLANSIGIGAFFNTLNVGQMLTLHIAVFPLAILGLLGWHLILVRGRVYLPRSWDGEEAENR
ncbi:MAG: cytochrome B6 [Actinomycetota bacterium]